jgi:hypothetical protein
MERCLAEDVPPVGTHLLGQDAGGRDAEGGKSRPLFGDGQGRGRGGGQELSMPGFPSGIHTPSRSWCQTGPVGPPF